MTDIMTYMAALAAGVLTTFLTLGWNLPHRSIDRFVTISFLILFSGSVISRLFLYDAGNEPAPAWYLVFVNIVMTTIAVLLSISIWMRILRAHHSDR
jgi:aromatic ring-opening dioxygenase catalytic subunit (LigB family)